VHGDDGARLAELEPIPHRVGGGAENATGGSVEDEEEVVV